jgi:hypothetical protein|nr:MAG TPA: hypothetical protein [Caudoviricetes sp.]
MNFIDWYTDRMDVWRVVAVESDNLTRHTRIQMYAGIPCRVYTTGAERINMQRTAAEAVQDIKLACSNDIDIRIGDEVLITRGGGLGKENEPTRAFVADAHQFYEPFGAAIPGLAHQEIRLQMQERVD